MSTQTKEVSVTNNQKLKITAIEEALELTGDGIFKYFVIIVCGINLLAGFIITLAMSYVLPVTECDLNLSSTEKGILASMSFSGMIFSSHLFGFLSDTYGRRYVIVRTNLICIFLTLLASFAPNASILAVLWFANGFVIAGSISPVYVLVSEFCTFKSRTKCLLMSAAISSLVGTYLACIAWIIMPLQIDVPITESLHFTSWRLYLALTAVPLLIGNIAFMFLPESPKYLLSRGYKVETLRVLRSIFTINTNRRPEEYPVVDVCLDPDDEQNDLSKDQGFLKTMLNQTYLLFKPPILKYTLISCFINLALIGSYNVIMLWLPETVSKIQIFEEYKQESTKLCDALLFNNDLIEPKVQLNLLNSSQSVTNQSYYYSTDDTCTVVIDKDTYFVNIIIGIAQFCIFTVSSKITEVTGRKPILVIFALISSVCSLVVNLVSIEYTAIFLGSFVTFVGAILPVATSIFVDYFPTHLRTMATCINMTFGRTGASVGSQLFGLLQTVHCDVSYYILTGFMSILGILFLTIPQKR